MIICHVCAAQCEDDAELCPVCGAQLDRTPDETEEDAGVVIANPCFAVSVEDIVTAEIYKDMLKENGIPFTLSEEDQVRVVFGGGMSAVDIYVDESNLDKAKEIFEQVLESETFFDEDFDEDFEEEE